MTIIWHILMMVQTRRLTLKHLNKLRKVREMRKADQEKNKEFVATMYAQPRAM